MTILQMERITLEVYKCMRVVDVSARVISQSFTVVLVDNDVVECDETFIVTILSVITCALTIGNNNSSEVIITDDDSK